MENISISSLTKQAVWVWTVLIALSLLGCGQGNSSSKKENLMGNKSVSSAEWDKLAEQKIFFGHQSVGFNIVEGMDELLHENPGIRLNIRKTAEPSSFGAPVFAHSTLGGNGDPKSKVERFAELCRKGICKSVDMAFFKFCFADIESQTDVGKVFGEYKATMAGLEAEYPTVKFVHFTVPLTRPEASIKEFVKRVIGRTNNEDNIRRQLFNEMLLREYQGREPVFDLATIESTNQDGTRVTFQKDGETSYRLASDYTDDGGHLNTLGRKVVAERLLIFLAHLSNDAK